VVDEALARPLSAVRFRWRARLGFFLRAEAPVVGLGYPVPPRTAVLGLVANVLGMPKDALADGLEGARVALSGRCPRTHWHGCNLRKIKQMRFLPPTFSAKKPVELAMPEESNTQSRQEWLCDPDFEVVAVLPSALHDDFAARMREGRTHFTPCMGLSEMLASVEHLSDETLTPLPEGLHSVRSVVHHEGPTRLAIDAVLGENLKVLSLSLPRTVTEERRFTHASYFVARDGGPLPVHTGSAWQSSTGAVMFL
jgi:CRISPR-associated protein Cas5h